MKDFCCHCQELTDQQSCEYIDCTLIVCQHCGTAVDRVWKEVLVGMKPMPKHKGLEVAHRLVIHAKKPGVIVVTAIGKRRMLAEAEREVADFVEQKQRKPLPKPPLAGYVKRQ